MRSSSATFTTPRRRFLGIADSITGKGIRIAIVDSFFPPHPDVLPNETREVYWLDARGEPFDPAETARANPQRGQHGLGRAAVAGGSGESSSGRYCGVAPECDMALLNYGVVGGEYQNTPEGLRSCLEFLVESAERLGIRAVEFGTAADRTGPLVPWQWDEQRRYCERLTSKGVLVVSGTGNCPGSFSPTSLAPSALAGGGLVMPIAAECRVRAFHSPEGVTFEGRQVPEYRVPAEMVIMPSLDPSEECGVPGVPTGHTVQEGMSFGDPFMLGLLACVWQKHPELDAKRMRLAVQRAARSVTPRFGATRAGMPTWEAMEEAIGSISDLSCGPTAPFRRYAAVQRMAWHERTALIKERPDQAADILLNSLPDRAPQEYTKELAICYGRSKDARARAAIVLLLGPREEHASFEHSLLDQALRDDSPLVVGCALDAMRHCPVTVTGREERIAALINHADGQVRYEALLLAEAAPNDAFVPPLIEGMERDLDAGPLIAFFFRRRCLKKITGETCWPETRGMLPGECVYSDYWLGMQRECARRWRAWLEARES